MSAVVYWLLDAEDNVLYIGCTMSLKSRMAHHSQVRTWWRSVASVAHTGFMPRVEALRVESEDIFALQPRYNVAERFGLSGIEIAQTCHQINQRLKTPGGHYRFRPEDVEALKASTARDTVEAAS